jgi:hypothetical protein
MQVPRHCEHCGREFDLSQVFVGWHPCQCSSGHMHAHCRADARGCGHTTYDPPMQDDTCRRVCFGYEGTS